MSTKTSKRTDSSSKGRLSIESFKGAQSGIFIKVQESASALNDFLQQWNKLHASGILILSTLKTKKLDSMNSTSTQQVYSPGLQEGCDQLQIVIDKMKACLNNLAILVQQFHALVELDFLQNGNYCTVNLSWSTEKFREAYRNIYDAFFEELALKNAIKEDIAHCTRRDELIFHVTSWTSQPFIRNSCRILCESLLIESGLK